MRYTTKMACKLLGRDRKQQADDIATGHCGHVPRAIGGLRYWEGDDLAVELYFIELRADGYSLRLAGLIATQLREAMRDNPDADQITLVRCANRNRFALATDMLDLSSGYTSGNYLLSATLIDVRNLRERVRRVIEAYEPKGELQDAAA